MEKVRVRFAPSPTGPLHLGGVRTALYDYLFAKNQGGEFVLRIEDTDTARYVEGAEEYIEEALEWCGIIPDESPKKGGKFAPYRQSERRDIYDRYTEQILKTDYAYLAFDTPEELDAIRTEFEARGDVFSYDNKTRNRLKNSIALSEEEVQKLLDNKTPYVVRFRMPVDRTLNLEDIIRGNFSVNTDTLDDKVLVKNDGMPTYHFANIIDDHEMEITHVIRGEEWLPSLGLHTLLYEAMGWTAPKFAHLSLILKPEGKGKLSKRDGDKFGFPVFPLDFKDPATGMVSKGYRENGYLPEAFINMVALLGWSPVDDKEILSLEEMTREFDLYKVHKAGARFSKEKAEWFNHQYMQAKPDEELLQILKMSGFDFGGASDDKLLKVIRLMKERATFPKDIYENGKFFFEAPASYDEKALKKAWNDETSSVLSELAERLEGSDFNAEAVKQTIHDFAESKGLGMGKVMMPLRLVLVGELKGPDVPDILEIIGKEESLARIKTAVEQLK
ncbi:MULTISPECIES: glutamate--tRNA ligase [Chryseobacterium]|uniref:Glutamate--tRNA ligase n=1 Tax=Chryseobacterium camelliae TaxID=1265445 RepID=A0ABU0TLA9_9FLAO|nr:MULTISPECIES: glutamate--tRNA ligase [Chryseobacterium]MDT3408322.1 nondiscriminating glutamyl-tRNA synthetase [Pseudacidovorax intermedius]MDQ1097822.1 nondiscriminating glutamyl-tRNA synthetase [Chryseobacterium camelliae]MDQ1101754.1 nondiscriminating glutamyl-tRNA synthetase [Chryseobacterium sp. SORGH_AS_1048]MDR6085194.1 nondiscriminating glutamyl-tRNA synthetase [Chryseobacterium sp. SORGH_AS_0909]MDR6129552.1 nondiscriminating glutamyl-tRNA synthetase [Chryseobacterium sp. SORGH_AS_